MADINLQIGVSKSKNFTLRDATNNAPISANYSNLQFSNSNPASATFQADSGAPDPESLVKAIPVAVGSGTVAITVDVTYTDPGDGVQRTETKTLTKTFEVTGTPHGANLELVFP